MINTENLYTLTILLNKYESLKLFIKLSHWNYKGLNFKSIHDLLDEIYNSLNEFADIVAERIAISQNVKIEINIPTFEDDILKSVIKNISLLSETLNLMVKNFKQDDPFISTLQEHELKLDKFVYLLNNHILNSLSNQSI